MASEILVKTEELDGHALDWAVAVANGLNAEKNGLRYDLRGRPTVAGEFAVYYQPSKNWLQCGPLIEKYNICVSAQGEPTEWSASVGRSTDEMFGKTPMVAICRALVAEKVGDEVMVPALLVGGAA
ncbi:phage protein NinX family protein [Aeromonas caviae]|uniref:phage protein NinX family protein n=1 Tax=Aeromonas caviae TaxID=648 RepID=UPI00191FA47E|nr:phage protein NinX family protein [Aeromonas caviae]MBL0581662.1 DUF2591 family protein [Aeromonas caviae]